ncbi:hypothetical protein AOQ84DRAFT_97563 [Glonium stellatum]|uniref:Uncharacterized protein n=1 Tax=Glonium stellatum TaxID=574774 RepID=A0A8E2JQ61_9PEZI|nr:hypothetical protein AOQ84DRAFT_97563 [Glonium stellatum]
MVPRHSRRSGQLSWRPMNEGIRKWRRECIGCGFNLIEIFSILFYVGLAGFRTLSLVF